MRLFVPGLPEADGWEAAGEGAAGGTESPASRCSRHPAAWLSSKNRPITSGCQKAGFDRTASLSETWVQFKAIRVARYPASDGSYAVPSKHKFSEFKRCFVEPP